MDVVLGPGTDGGYYLIGCKPDRLRQSIFHNIPWSTKTVFAETLKRIAEAGLKASVLREWSDIDELDDLKRFYERNKDQKSRRNGLFKDKGDFAWAMITI